MLKPINILLVGVGGQGTILATRVLAKAAQDAGYDIKVSEIKGMAQRGGSVVTQVRLGEKVYSPIISQGGADVILAFEKMEALRWLSYLKPDGHMIVNDQAIPPVPVLTGAAVYPTDCLARVKQAATHTIVVDALNIAIGCGNPRAANVVLIGLLARRLPIAKDTWLQALQARVPEKFLDVNLKAFEKGYAL
ncbi:indolepyruvate ferredoxin oxidoreductase beta subunit [Desulforamulus putei DSM 12395]|uniref:Indolepyruvate ferredoxin oxidoreductase beta subunit n=1 Tax=Desulforamulus putei DSM 12395 TaxID=1121429 RepID=A0A1M4XX71_9FIRM|nr:indolepyruvate oxidoreductase subunit beta [Desulforamulus putei]SHE98028.1 indolepyruvate ferredoxin oxidoreductase beta subunit [Desulforamulus putei DSM 12395]